MSKGVKRIKILLSVNGVLVVLDIWGVLVGVRRGDSHLSSLRGDWSSSWGSHVGEGVLSRGYKLSHVVHSGSFSVHIVCSGDGGTDSTWCIGSGVFSVLEAAVHLKNGVEVREVFPVIGDLFLFLVGFWEEVVRVHDNVKGSGSELTELSKHYVFRDSSKTIDLSKGRGFHKDLYCLLERRFSKSRFVHPVDSVS